MAIGDLLDPDSVRSALNGEGIEVVTSARILRVEGKSGEQIKLRGTRDGSEVTLEGSILWARLLADLGARMPAVRAGQLLGG